MPRHKNLIPSQTLNTALPIDAYSMMTAFLFSEAEGRVPTGAYASFISARIREYFTLRQLDLAPLVGTPPGTFFVAGTPEAIEQLTNAFKEKV